MEVYDAPNPKSSLWNNGIVIAYMLNRRVALNDILTNKDRESGLNFEEVPLEELLSLTE